jgi:hypothetical protein
MQCMIPDISPEERRLVHRWSLAVVAVYATVMLACVITLWLTAAPSGETRQAEVNAAHAGTSK